MSSDISCNCTTMKRSNGTAWRAHVITDDQFFIAMEITIGEHSA